MKYCTMRKIIFCTTVGRPEQQGGTKISCMTSHEPNEPTKEGTFCYLLLESPFASVSTVDRGHPSLITLVNSNIQNKIIVLEKRRQRFFAVIGTASTTDPSVIYTTTITTAAFPLSLFWQVKALPTIACKGRAGGGAEPMSSVFFFSSSCSTDSKVY